MKECPNCGKKFNWWQRAIGEYKEHLMYCNVPKKKADELTLANMCRGCPADCFERIHHANKGQKHEQKV